MVRFLLTRRENQAFFSGARFIQLASHVGAGEEKGMLSPYMLMHCFSVVAKLIMSIVKKDSGC